MSRWSKAGAAALIGAAVIAVGGCGSQGLQSVPLPGGAPLGDNPRTYKLQFLDVLDLVPQSTVKFNGIEVGRVQEIKVAPDQWTAEVTIEVQDRVDLSDEARAEIQQTNLLGEKYVALEDPQENADLPRQNPDEVIGCPSAGGGECRTRTATDIEQVLGALSLLLNGGGVAQIKPIVDELNKALEGRQTEVKGLLNETARLIDGLDDQKDDIVTALDGLDALSTRARAQTDQINRVLDELPKGIQVLEEQRPQFVTMLQQLDRLGEAGVAVLGTAHDAIITDLKALRPVLQSLAQAAPDIITAAPLLFTYPFPDSLLPAVIGDSTNLFGDLDLRLLNQLEALGVGQGEPVYSPPKTGPTPIIDPQNPYYNGNGPRLGWPTITLLPLPNAQPGPNTPPSGGQYALMPDERGQQSFIKSPLNLLTNANAAAATRPDSGGGS
ncbi:UNVERIFIED_CONTAM: phospholipid/cholesterol/gamma-HCH transport system substrate-binding protein [Williamsia faeni]